MTPALHQVQLAGSLYYANMAVPSLPTALAAEVTTIEGLSTLPGAHPLTISGAVANDPLAALSSIIDANVLRVVSISSDACLEDFSAITQAALQSELRQAEAQGMTVLAASGCGSRGSAGFPSALSEVTAVAVAPGISPATSPTLTEHRPVWQIAPGLPADSFRHEVDLTVNSLDALAQKVTSVIATQTENNAPLRLGNINHCALRERRNQGSFHTAGQCCTRHVGACHRSRSGRPRHSRQHHLASARHSQFPNDRLYFHQLCSSWDTGERVRSRQ